MFWALLIAATIFAVGVITITVILDKIKEYLRKRKKELMEKGIKIVEAEVKECIEKGEYKVIKIGLIGKRKSILPWKRKVNLGEIKIEGQRVDNEITEGKVLDKIVVEEL